MSNHLFEAIRTINADGSARFVETPDGVRLTYADMFERSAAFAGALEKSGVDPGDRVLVQVEKSVDALMLYLATVRAGAVFVPVNTAYTLAELEYFIGGAEPKLIVCSPPARESIARLPAAKNATIHTLGVERDGSFVEHAAATQGEWRDAARGPDDLAALLYTSGTTGRSKGAMLTHGNLLSNARALVKAWRFTRDDVLLHALPIFHTHGLFTATNTILCSGASMILLPKFDADQVVAALPRATCMMGVPTFYVRLLHHRGVTRDTTKRIRVFISGSAPLLAETHARWREKTGHAILERYGMTETSMNTSNPYDAERRAGTVGFPLDGVELRIVDPSSGVELKRGEIGMIEIRGPNVCKGYWRMPDKTRAEFHSDGFFITGDLGMIDADFYLSIVGRGKDLIITGGYNVYPKEVEGEIDAIEGVVESAVFGVPHPDLGEAVVAVAVADGRTAPDEAQLMAALGARLARFKLPKRLYFVDELPRNTMGKVQKNVLRDDYAGLFNTGR